MSVTSEACDNSDSVDNLKIEITQELIDTVRLNLLSKSHDDSDVSKVTEICTKLIKVCANNNLDIHSFYKNKQKPLNFASEKGHTEIVQLLLDDKVDVNFQDEEGKTALYYASQSGHTEIVKLLLNASADVNITDNCYLVTVLYLASQNGHTEIVKLLLNANADVNNIDRDGDTVLHIASRNRHTDIVKLLINANVDVNITNIEGRTAMSWASDMGHTEIVKLLLDANADVNMQDKTGHTALHYASQIGHTEVIKLLLVADAEVNIVNKMGCTALHLALQCKHADIVKLLLSAKADVDLHNNYGCTALCIASQNGYTEIVQLLLDANADVNVGDNNGHTALYCASKNNHTDIVRLLLSVKADTTVKYKYQEGGTVLCIASKEGHTEIVNLLLEAKAEVDIKDIYGKTALYWATKCGQLDIVKLLVNANANVNIQANNGYTALHCGSKDGYTAIVELLLNHNVDVNIEDTEGITALYMATANGHTEVVKLLLEAKADANITDKNGVTMLCCASNSGETKIVKLLLDASADVNIQSKDGYTALFWASQNGHTEIVQLLLNANANVNRNCDEGDTAPLFWASRNGNTHIVQLLLAVNADANIKHKNGTTSLYWAARNGHTEIVQMLLCANVDVNIKDKDETTALYWASKNMHSEVVNLLLSVHSDVNCISKDGSTVLHTAVMNKQATVVQLLLNHGAKILMDKNLKTPYDLCTVEFLLKKYEFLPIFLHLIEYGMNVDGEGNEVVYTPLLYDSLIRNAVFAPSFATLPVLQHHNYALWCHLLQDTFADTTDTVRSLVEQHPNLASAKDRNGRVVIELAIPEKKSAINSVLLWHGKYRVLPGKPEHTSATCFVFKAVDETLQDASGNGMPVALKLMKVKARYDREVSSRQEGFDGEFVVDIIAQYSPTAATSNGDVEMPILPDSGTLTKKQVERMYCIAMPLADRNLFVALKQERFVVQSDLAEVKHIFTQLVICVQHLHSKNFLHGDLKTLNIVRVGTQWKLIDLDASCRIGVDAVGAKASSAYVPPEAVYVDVVSSTAVVKSDVTSLQYNFAPLIAHPSFDIWSLGCLLYQMCANGKTLFQASLDDNLSGEAKDRGKDDSLWSLAEWSTETKFRKLSEVQNPLAANLLSLMLSKDPRQRPSISRILVHPFLSGKLNTRMVGTEAEFDVFISYRVASDAHHAEILYDLLIARGLKVWWDKKCLLPGVDWEKGFCTGLVNSKAFVCLLSLRAVSHPTIAWQNFSKLDVDSRCDNVLLEHRLALELREIGLIEKVFPVLIGEVGADGMYSRFNAWPSGSHTHVTSLESALCKHMDNASLGTPLHPNKTVSAVCTEITKCQGAFIEGESSATFVRAVEIIASMCNHAKASIVSKLRDTVKAEYSCDCG